MNDTRFVRRAVKVRGEPIILVGFYKIKEGTEVSDGSSVVGRGEEGGRVMTTSPVGDLGSVPKRGVLLSWFSESISEVTPLTTDRNS